jgi:hypothetical protein
MSSKMATSSIFGARCRPRGFSGRRRRPPAGRAGPVRPNRRRRRLRRRRAGGVIRDSPDRRRRGRHGRLRVHHVPRWNGRLTDPRRPHAGRLIRPRRGRRRDPISRRFPRWRRCHSAVGRHFGSIPGPRPGRDCVRRGIRLRRWPGVGIALVEGDRKEADDRYTQDNAGHRLAIHLAEWAGAIMGCLHGEPLFSSSDPTDGDLRRSGRFRQQSSTPPVRTIMIGQSQCGEPTYRMKASDRLGTAVHPRRGVEADRDARRS